MRLIDADALYEEHTRLAYKSKYAFHIAARAWLEQAPTVDAVPVVRCRECVHHVDCGYHFCNKWCANCPDDSDFFCAYGERDGGVKDAAD